MDMNGEYRIAAPQQVVWDALNDPEILRACITGCETVEKVSDTEFTAKVTFKVGPVKAKFTGDVTLSDIDAPNSYTISGSGKGGAAGFGKGGAQVSLKTDGDETVLTYTANASVGGKLAQVGQRLIDSTSKKLATQFFSRFAAHLSGDAEIEPGAPVDVPATGTVPDKKEPAVGSPSGQSNLPWLIAGVSVVLLAVCYFTR
jgi:carbon monoxide dehydrogenase subunit G